MPSIPLSVCASVGFGMISLMRSTHPVAISFSAPLTMEMPPAPTSIDIQSGSCPPFTVIAAVSALTTLADDTTIASADDKSPFSVTMSSVVPAWSEMAPENEEFSGTLSVPALTVTLPVVREPASSTLPPLGASMVMLPLPLSSPAKLSETPSARMVVPSPSPSNTIASVSVQLAVPVTVPSP